jgi:L-asparaginase II
MRILLAIAVVACSVAAAAPAVPTANPMPPGKAQLLAGLRLQVSLTANRLHRRCSGLHTNAACLHQAHKLATLRAQLHAVQQLPAARVQSGTDTY